MKLITKFSDYYDHLIGKFGYDDSRVYDRRNENPKPYLDTCLSIAIAGKIYPVVAKWKNGKVIGHFHEKSPQLDRYENLFLEDNRNKKTNLNEKYRQPVVIEITNFGPYPKFEAKKTYFVPILAEFGFASIVPAEEMYELVYNYLGWLKDNPVPPNKQTDKDKVAAHGFDVKKSFRPKMK